MGKSINDNIVKMLKDDNELLKAYFSEALKTLKEPDHLKLAVLMFENIEKAMA